ncbi:iron complex transport system permease protein [Anaerocolumna jejuensis DSM 15929]|uniref:Iron complex transport system permease protein n=1 Tax=Anaerocolumna jejuensis DSM 15929 TaxID=1121322 RepID=A0A1M6UBS4_9FIRM|nr:iron ABC transporter permease [Anaerocolumna jejuensis]SHK66611.1 iron complex transport system permease protein [Anaerocolumna jejuensis DSM 15929]
MERKNDGKLRRNRGYKAFLLMVAGGLFLLFFMVLSIMVGAAKIPLSTVGDAFLHFDGENMKHLMVIDLRLPRVISAAVTGAALAAAGAVMQGMTRNPLADSGLMGLNSGAALAMAICLAYVNKAAYSQIILSAFIGAGAGALAVYGISSLVPGGNKPMKLVLSGAAVSTFLVAVSQAIAIGNKMTQNLNFWTMGSVTGNSWNQLKVAVPVMGSGILIAILLSRRISILNMGEEVALGLGVRIAFVKTAGTLVVVLLAGTSVALAGSITFVGMLIPHFARYLVGPDYRLIIPLSTILGALLLVVADIGAKTLSAPGELPIGALISLLGVPVFLYFARRQKGEL